MKNKLRLIAAFLPFLVGVKAYSQYCSPTTGTNGCLYGDYISSVNMGTITNSTSCSPGSYGDYTAMSTTVDLGNSYTATVGINPDFNQGVGIFVDWNHDNDFSDAGEFYGGSVVVAGGSTNISVTVPTTAIPGTTRMRVGCQYAVSIGASNSCATSGNYGEYEDYTLLVRNSLQYSAGTANNGWANPTITLNNFSTCQNAVSLNADCAVYNGSSWSSGSYVVMVNGTNIGTYNGAQTINLSAYMPVTTVFIDPTAPSNWTSVGGTVTIISSSPSTPVSPSTTATVNYCQGATPAPLSATVVGTGTTLKWYTTVNGHNYSASAPTPSTSTAGTTSYYVSQAEAGGCESPRAKIDVVVNALPPAPMASNQVHCSGDLVSDLVPNPSSTINWYSTAASTTPLATNTTIVAGNYYVGQTDANGCNSPKTVAAITMANNTGTETQIACSSYTWATDGNTYSSSGAYTATLTNVAGCDSVVTLNLTINQPSTSSETQEVCSSYTWDANGTTYTESGTYVAMLTNMNGCDSIATLNLTVHEPNSGSEIQEVCSSFTWDANGMTYTESGTYVATLTNMNGCDSIATLNLTVNEPTSGSETQEVCSSFTWDANGMTYTESGTYVATLTNMNGCDSTATLNLTVNEPTSGSETHEVCSSFTWDANGMTYTESGTYIATLPNAAGCDSVVTLILTVNSVPTALATDNGDGTVTASAGSSYQWINCDTGNPIANATQQTFSPTVNGNYSVEVTNASGCSDVSSCVLIDNLGVEDQSVVAANVYPNPTTGQVVIELNVSSARFTLTDVKGSIVLEGKLSNGGGLDLSSYETGVYLLNLHHENGMLVKRIVKK